MDMANLVEEVSRWLAPFVPYLLKAGKEATKEAGKKFGAKAWDVAKDIWGKLRPKVEAEAATGKALQDVAASSSEAEAQAALQSQLAELLSTDKALAADITNLWVAAKDAGIVVMGDLQTGGITTHGPVSGHVVGRDMITYQTPPPSVTSLHQLPPPPGDFTGREVELQELMEAVQKDGVTISGLRGACGIGKTALALRLAEQLKGSYPDAQFYLDLKGTTDPLTPAQAMAHVIRGFHPEAKLPDDEAQLSALYRSVLYDKRALLLMDNARSAEQVEPLIPPAGCVMLVTSRWQFDLPGLLEKNLDIMSESDARDLLLKIAPRIRDCAEKIAKVCGYFPLALRLAASALVKTKTVSPTDYVKRLEKAGGAVELIEPCLNLSYELLDAEMQELWRMLAVFPGTFVSPAAAAVWEISQEKAEDALNTLISYSLVECDETTRRCHLHDLVRQSADSRLSESEREEARRRHAEHYKNVLTAIKEHYKKGGDAVMRGLAIFDVERINIEAGQAWAAARREQDDAAAKLCSAYPAAGAYILGLRQHPREHISWLEAALGAARHLKDRAAEGVHLGNLGVAYKDLGEPHRAIKYYEQVLPIARKKADRRSEGIALGSLGLAYAALGKPRRAIEYYKQRLEIAREIGDRRGEGNVLGNLGIAYSHLGETRRAIECYKKSLEIKRETGDRRGEGNSLGNLGLAYADSGEPCRAIEYYEQHLAIAREIGDRRGEANDLWNMSLALDALGKRDEAIPKAEAALEIFEQIEDPGVAKVREQLEEWRKG